MIYEVTRGSLTSSDGSPGLITVIKPPLRKLVAVLGESQGLENVSKLVLRKPWAVMLGHVLSLRSRSMRKLFTNAIENLIAD